MIHHNRLLFDGCLCKEGESFSETGILRLQRGRGVSTLALVRRSIFGSEMVQSILQRSNLPWLNEPTENNDSAYMSKTAELTGFQTLDFRPV
jgi:hypothetical protein